MYTKIPFIEEVTSSETVKLDQKKLCMLKEITMSINKKE